MFEDIFSYYVCTYASFASYAYVKRKFSSPGTTLLFLSARAKPERFYILLKLSIFLPFYILVSFFPNSWVLIY